ncbi:B3 domain-containing protein Os12g0592300-like [Carex rostrata]
MDFQKEMTGFFMHSVCLPEKVMKHFLGFSGQLLELERQGGGGTWHVGLIGSGNKLILQPGWSTFAGANNISQNDLLHFKFMGESKFEVQIFDSTGYEKCIEESHKLEINIPAIKQELDDLSPNPRKCVAPYNEVIYQSRNMVLNAGQKRRAKQMASEVQARNPAFLTVIRRSNLTSKCNISIPIKFSAEHLPKETREMALHRPKKEMMWPVKYYYRKGHQSFEGTLWRKFVQENNLQEGDMCLFEMVKAARQIKFVVHISKAIPDHVG